MGIRSVYQINEDIRVSGCYIFGTGWHAKQTYIELLSQGIEVAGFADREVGETNKELYGLPVIDEEKLAKLNPHVIVASVSWKEICDRLSKSGLDNLYVDKSRYGDVEIIDSYLRTVGNHSFDKETLYILCPAGIGDTLYAAAFVEAIKKEMNCESVVLITKKAHTCIGKMFEAVDDTISSDNLVNKLEEFSIYTGTWNLKNYIYAHMKKNRCHTFLSEYYDNQDLNIVDYYRKVLLNLPETAELSKLPRKTNYVNKHVKKVILFPYAATAKMLPFTFWEDIAKNYISQGFDVYSNTKDLSEEAVLGTQIYSGHIEETIKFCDDSIVIAIRSGMCDVLAMSGARLFVLDTDPVFYNKWNLAELPGSRAVHIRCFDRDEKGIKKELYDCISKDMLKHVMRGIVYCPPLLKMQQPACSSSRLLVRGFPFPSS